jgi:uncharacterized BrkB/YihY/UPF0761 family membrane protein
MYKFSNHTNDKKEKFIKISSWRNGFLKEFIQKHHERQNEKISKIEFKEISLLLFMSLILVRTLISVTISDENHTLLMYIGRFWHLLDANYIHNEVLFILWDLYFICIYVFLIESPTKHYKWIEIYAFLNGILPHQQIGKYLFVFQI